MRINFLGTGGSTPTLSRDNTSLLLDLQHSVILVDCPGSVSARLEKLGYQTDQVSDILVTHLHPDHVYGLPSIIHVLRNREKPLHLYGSPETIDFCLRLLQLFSLDREKIWEHIRFVKLVPGQSQNLSPRLKLTAYQVKHHSSSLAFLLAENGQRIFITGDTALDGDLLAQVVPLSVLVHDCSFPSTVAESLPALKSKHTNSLELGQAVAGLPVEILIPCHFMSELGFSVEDIEKEIRANYHGQLIMPDDFQVVEIA
ncbi:MAG: MBL fold metallo-hydrolase [Candidatus Aminicenantes bacterium]|nr:MBL fold metallo-hydrolase [Candidatus Aminicenantes bacterium]